MQRCSEQSGAASEIDDSVRGTARDQRDEIVKRGLPYLVAERAKGPDRGRVLGYCYAGLFRPRAAYRFTLEDSITSG